MAEEGVCSICGSTELVSESARQRGYCDYCQQAFGLWSKHAPSRRPPRPCARCGHGKLVRCQVRERAASGGDHSSRFLAPLALTFQRLIKTGFFSDKPKRQNAPDFDSPAGLLEAYVCQACGFVEWYASAPESIPIGPEFGTELIDVGPATGYR